MKKSYLSVLFVVLVFASCSDDVGVNEDRPDNGGTSVPVEYSDDSVVEGVMRVKLTAEAVKTFNPAVTRAGETSTGVALLDGLASKIGVKSMKRVFPDGGRFDARRRKAGLHLWYDIEFDRDQSVTRAVHDLSVADGFEVVEPILKVERTSNFSPILLTKELADSIIKSRQADPLSSPYLMNDGGLSMQWHYQNDGLTYNSVAGADINLFQAWEIETGKPEVIVAIIDGGVQYDHPDLEANMWVNQKEIAGDGIDNDGNGYIDDFYGYNFVDDSPEIIQHFHGTHVAGTVGAVNNNGIGVCGVAGGNGSPDSGVRLMSCQIFKDVNGRDVFGNAEAAFVYAADNGAVIAQNSWGYGFNGYNQAIPASMRAAIDYFIDNAGLDEDGQQEGPMAGGVVIFAAGNDNTSLVMMPGAYDRVISVTAFAPDYQRAYYSNYGVWTDIAAPGGDEYYGTTGLVLSTYTEGRYGFLQGTSMACPHVSGIAALVVSKYGVGKDGFTNDQLKNRILSSSNDISIYNPTHFMGVGYINAQKALADYGQKAPDRTAEFKGEWTFEQVKLSWRVSADADNGKVDRYELLYAMMPLFDIDFNNPPQGVSRIVFKVTDEYKVGDKMEMTLSGVQEGVTYFFSIAGFDSDGNRSVPVTIYGTPTENLPPVIGEIPRNITLGNTEKREIAIAVSDPEKYDWTYTLEAGSNALKTEKDGNSLVLIFDALAGLPGKYTAQLVVTDKQGIRQTASIPYTIEENHAPGLAKELEKEMILNGAGTKKTLRVSDYFTDEDGDALSYRVEISNPSVAIATQTSEGVMEITAIGLGTSKVNLFAADPRQKEAKATFDLVCRDANRAVDLYPTPIGEEGVLNVRMMDFEGTIEVTLYNMGGAKVFSEKAKIAPVSPVAMDLSSLSAGNYRAVIKYANKEYKQTITKL